MRPEPRPELLALPAATHGGSHDTQVLDFSTGVSPLSPPEEIVAAARNADLSRYPPPTALPVREAIAELHDVSPDRVVVGAGSVELIWALARAFAGPGRRGLVVKPAFAEYEQAMRASGATVSSVDMAEPRFAFPIEALDATFAGDPIATAFICRPSNPCLTAAPPDVLTALARRWPGTLFVVDEAYLPMFEGLDGVPLEPNIVVVRSLTKVFALPGLRLGYLLATPQVAGAVQASLPPWNVSAPAQAVGIAAARLLPVHGVVVRERIASLRISLRADLAPLVGTPAREGGPFLLYELDDAVTLVGGLRERGVALRHAASFGLPRYIRIGVRDERANGTLIERWKQLEGT